MATKRTEIQRIEFGTRCPAEVKVLQNVDCRPRSVEDLISIWKSGWRNLADLDVVNDEVVLEGFGSNLESPVAWAWSGLYEILTLCGGIYFYFSSVTGPDFIDSLIILAMTERSKTFDDIKESRNIRAAIFKGKVKGLRRAVQKVTHSFAVSRNCGEAFKELATKENRDMFVKYWSGITVQAYSDPQEKWSPNRFFSCNITARWQKAFQWLEYGLAGPEACAEAYWNCVWLYMQPLIDELLGIRRKVNSGIPITYEEISFLNYQMSFGSPRVCLIEDVTGKCAPRVLPQQTYGGTSTDFSCEKPANLLLLQPAFALAQELQNKLSDSRYTAKCRAPSCGKRFYTGRKNATACPGSIGNKKNKCALEWIRYKRWMQKTGRTPERDWDNENFKRLFISSDNG